MSGEVWIPAGTLQRDIAAADALTDALANGNNWPQDGNLRLACSNQLTRLRAAGWDIIPLNPSFPMGLTRAARQCLLEIQHGMDQRGVVPSFEELKVALGLKSKSGVHRIVNQLEERGYIERMRHRARAIRIRHRIAEAA